MMLLQANYNMTFDNGKFYEGHTYKGEVDPKNPEEFIIHAEDGQKQRMSKDDFNTLFTELDVYLI
jgi:hypothetical protein